MNSEDYNEWHIKEVKRISILSADGKEYFEIDRSYIKRIYLKFLGKGKYRQMTFFSGLDFSKRYVPCP